MPGLRPGVLQGSLGAGFTGHRPLLVVIVIFDQKVIAMDSPVKINGSNPGNIAAAVPHLLGFHPTDSLIIVGLRYDTEAMVTLHWDFPTTVSPSDGIEVAEFLSAYDCCAAMVLAFVDPAEPSLSDTIRTVTGNLLESAIFVDFAVLVHAGGYWFSSVDPFDGFADHPGLPVPSLPSPPSATTGSGHAAPGPSREAIIRHLQPADAKRRDDLLNLMASKERASFTAEEHLDNALHWMATFNPQEGTLTDNQIADLATCATHPDTALRMANLLTQEPDICAHYIWAYAASHLTGRYAASAYLMVAISSYRAGNGVIATEALNRSLSEDPRCLPAHMLLARVKRGCAPAALEQMFPAP